MSDVQHCPACDEEYVSGIPACVDCGGPLTPGPLPRFEAPATRPADAGGAAARGALDRLLARLPGKQADQAVRALLLENIACRVLCEGLEKTYTPERPPAEPFAVSLPVEVYVAAQQHDAAQDVLTSLEQEDLIGEQWSDVEGEPHALEPPVAAGASADEPGEDQYADAAPEPQGTSLVTAVLVVAVVLALLFLFGR
jgi:hypothetical protein